MVLHESDCTAALRSTVVRFVEYAHSSAGTRISSGGALNHPHWRGVIEHFVGGLALIRGACESVWTHQILHAGTHPECEMADGDQAAQPERAEHRGTQACVTMHAHTRARRFACMPMQRHGGGWS